MAMFRDRHDPVRLFVRRLGMVALLAAVVIVASAVWDVYGKEHDSHTLRIQSEQELSDLQGQEGLLGTNIAQLKTERGREEALRESYDVGRQGEGLIIIVEPPAPEPLPEESRLRQWVNKFLPFW